MIAVYYAEDAFEAVDALLDSYSASREVSREAVDGESPFSRLDNESRVVIKPNLVVAKKNWLGADTRPQVVEALVRRLKEHGVRRITIADGSGVGHSAGDAFELLGYREISRRYGVSLLDIEKDSFVSRPTKLKGPFKKLQISKTVADCDFLINVPVLKAHGETKLTCSLKNLKGVMSREMKPRFHSVDLHRAIAQLNTVVSADFILVDGGYGDLSSEMGGNPTEIGLLASGTDPLEIDTFAATTLGFSPAEIRHLREYAEYRGADLSSFRPRVSELNRPAEQRRFTVDTDPFGRFPCRVTDEGVCCTCRGNLVFALKRFSENGSLSGDQHFLIGRRGKIPAPGRGSGLSEIIAVGDCAAARLRAKEKKDSGGRDQHGERGERGDGSRRVTFVPGCPPSTRAIVDVVLMNLNFGESEQAANSCITKHYYRS